MVMNTNNTDSNAKLVIFADSFCPLCMNEMSHLARLDTVGAIKFIDIQCQNAMSSYPSISFEKANEILHGVLPNNQIILGLDVTHAAWKLVGKGYLTGLIRLPIISLLSDKVYLFFAKHRYRISFYLTGQTRCDESCSMQNREAYNSVFNRD